MRISCSTLISFILLITFSFFVVQNVWGQQYSLDSTLEPSLKLLGDGARWAARDGDTALFVNWKDNWLSHHLTDGIDWYWGDKPTYMDDWRLSITKALNYANFNIEYAGDIPNSLAYYDLVLINAWYAVEPHHAPILQDYIENGGAVVISGEVPCYLSVFCKDNWPYRVDGQDLTSIQNWFGASGYWNTDGFASIAVDNPFKSSFLTGEVIFSTSGSGHFVYSLKSDSKIVAQWDSDYGSGSPFFGVPYSYTEKIFAFTHEYGKGRVYYQAHFELDTDEDIFVNSVSIEIDPSLEIQPTEGLSQTTLQGSGFAPNSEISVTWNGTKMLTIPYIVQTDSYGNFSAMISVLNQTQTGPYQITAIDEMENQATSTFNVIPEFPSWIVLPLFLVSSLLVTIYKKKTKKIQ